jgi:hypothetical protein
MKEQNQFLRWYSGKTLVDLEALLPKVYASIKRGEWEPGVSRTLIAKLNKPNVLHKALRDVFGKDPNLNSYERDKLVTSTLDQMLKPGKKYETLSPGWRIGHDIRFGHVTRADDILKNLSYLRAPKTDVEREIVRLAREFAEDFEDLAKHIITLDNARPIPVFTSLGVSPTVTKTLQDASLDLVPKTVRVCPSEIVWKTLVKVVRGEEVKFQAPMLRLLWPKGTRFGRSRFNGGEQCQACGHGIRNPFNWVPLLIDDANGIPHSMWVGRDCSHKLFGIKVKGEVEVEGGRNDPETRG